MTNFEKIQGMTLEELANFLCRFVDVEVDECPHCPAWKYCKIGRNGFNDWLESEAAD